MTETAPLPLLAAMVVVVVVVVGVVVGVVTRKGDETTTPFEPSLPPITYMHQKYAIFPFMPQPLLSGHNQQ